MWKAYKNVETGIVHAVRLPAGMSPHGHAMNWPLVETDAPLSCHLCLQFAYEWRFRDTDLFAMLPDNFSLEGKNERRCARCGAPVSRCCC